VEVYDPATGRWRTVAGLPTARWSPGADHQWEGLRGRRRWERDPGGQPGVHAL